MAEHAAPIANAPVSPNSSMSTTPGHQRAGDRADRVRRVELPECRAQVTASREVPGQRRQGRSHHHRGRRQGEDRQAHPHERERGRRSLEGRIDPPVDLVDQAERDRGDDDDAGEDDLEPAVQAKRSPDAIGEAAADH